MHKQLLPTWAIAVKQPWAFLLVHGFKDVENRTWRLPSDFEGGWALIHASAKPGFYLAETKRLMGAAFGKKVIGELPQAGRETGGIVGMVRFGRAVRGSKSPWAEKEPGTWHWEVTAARPLQFMPCKGQLGFFKVDYLPPAGVTALGAADQAGGAVQGRLA